MSAEERAETSQIIDTTLLKCYLQTNDALICPLLSLKDNNCHMKECERVLTRSEKYSELVLLYESKGKHKKALDLLLQQAHNKVGPLRGHESMVKYLQKFVETFCNQTYDNCGM
ncbi:vam6/Vps39-like protein isoform X3 [Corticium candelabrum]|uniref:vam6/Vps39-like protein isoform X3 n=1 Tax=Corticium candelabrum TaxID=121492 RepID=UPI002E253DD6|nr:vam6/Vps39-like protein isoform X3 [Corticium candelabrum]